MHKAVEGRWGALKKSQLGVNSLPRCGGGDPDPWGALPQCFRTAYEEVFGWAITTCWGGQAEQKKRQQETPVSECWQFTLVWWGQGEGRQAALTHWHGRAGWRAVQLFGWSAGVKWSRQNNQVTDHTTAYRWS